MKRFRFKKEKSKKKTIEYTLTKEDINDCNSALKEIIKHSFKSADIFLSCHWVKDSIYTLFPTDYNKDFTKYIRDYFIRNAFSSIDLITSITDKDYKIDVFFDYIPNIKIDELEEILEDFINKRNINIPEEKKRVLEHLKRYKKRHIELELNKEN